MSKNQTVDEELRQTKIKLRDAETRIADLNAYIKELEDDLGERETPPPDSDGKAGDMGE